MLAATLLYSLLVTRQYQAETSVVIDIKPDPVSSALQGALTSPAVMATQVDIIESDRVATREVRNLKLDQNPQLRLQWQEDA